MFWQSVRYGVAAFGHWQVWLAVGLYALVWIAFLVIPGVLQIWKPSGASMATGCVWMTVGGTALTALCRGLLIVYLSPLLLGYGNTASLGMILNLFWPALWVGLYVEVAILLLYIVLHIVPMVGPLVGTFVGCSTSISSFLKGIIVFQVLSHQLVYGMLGNWDGMLGNSGQATGVYPGFWICVCLLAVSWLINRLALLPVGLVLGRCENTDQEGLVFVVVGPAIGILASLLPLFMYMSYVRLAIQQAQSHLH